MNQKSEKFDHLQCHWRAFPVKVLISRRTMYGRGSLFADTFASEIDGQSEPGRAEIR